MIEEYIKLIKEYPGLYRFYQVKRRMFPIEKCLAHFPRRGTLVDLGCGNGLLTGLLCLRAPQMRVIGMDDDQRKLATARKVFGDFETLRFVRGDIVEAALPQGDHFSLVDVLYLINFSAQEKILASICRSMPENGLFLLKEMDNKPLYKFWFNIFQETVSVKLLGRTLGGRFYFRSSKEMVSLLKRVGFASVEVIPLHRGYLYPHILYRAAR
jgi:2-polyprenyl-6-hydroxyphenyl methylase/3-demethylubiquinone-9 3-methyltransferase